MGRWTLAAVITALLLAGLVLPASAQDGKDAPPGDRPAADKPAPEKVPAKTGGSEAEQKKPAAEEGKTAGGDEKAEKKPEKVAGEKVELKLKGGVTLSGVVKGPRYEILHGSQYVPVASRDVPGAGVRIYYAMGLNGFLFVPYDSMDEIHFFGTITDEESARIARRLEAARQKAEEDRQRAIAEVAAMKHAPDTRKEGGEQTPEEKAAEREREQKIHALLERFPPEKWKPSRLDELKKRAIILDIYPNDEERAFMDNYDLWLEGYRMWEKARAGSSQPAEEGTGEGKDQSPKSTKPAPGER